MRHLLLLDTGGAGESPLWSTSRDVACTLAGQPGWRVSHYDLSQAPDVATAAVDLVRRAVRGAERLHAEPGLILRGSLTRQRRVLWGVVAAGLRTRLRVALHVRAAHVPFGSDLADVFPLADLIVTESAFGARAVSCAAREQGMTLRCSPVAIPPLLDPGLRTAHVDDRTATRRAWDIPADGLVIGCSSGGPADARAFLALQLFRAFAQGLYWACRRCGRTPPFVLDDTLAHVDVSVCAYCLSSEGARGLSRPDAWLLVLEGALTDRPAGVLPPQWSLTEYADACGLQDRVRVARARDHAGVTSGALLSQALLAMDVHVVPHHLADIEAAVLAGCALGVPTITTDFGAAAELLGSRARLVPPCALTYASDGQCVALMDAGLALHELRTLTGPSSVRAADGHGGPTVALAPDPAALAEWRQQVEWMWATA